MTNIYDLTQETTPLGTDILYILIDPSGSPEDRYITVQDLLDSIQVETIIDVDAAEAFLVRKDGDAGDVLVVDTTNSRVGVGGTPNNLLQVFQQADSNGIKLSGYDDKSGENVHLFIDSSGNVYFQGTENMILDSDKHIYLDLGDAAGSYHLNLRDSAYATVFQVTSDGDVDIAGDLEIGGEVGYKTITTDSIAASAVTIDWTADNIHKVELDSDVTFTFTAPTNYSHLTLILEGDGTARSLTWPATVKWLEPGEPTWSSTDGDKNLVSFVWDGTDYIASGGAAN